MAQTKKYDCPVCGMSGICPTCDGTGGVDELPGAIFPGAVWPLATDAVIASSLVTLAEHDEKAGNAPDDVGLLREAAKRLLARTGDNGLGW